MTFSQGGAKEEELSMDVLGPWRFVVEITYRFASRRAN